MKNDLKFDPDPASISVQAAARQNKKQLQKLETQAAAGSTLTHNVMGTSVSFKLEMVPPENVESATMVFMGNERNQLLLDKHAVSDLMHSFSEQGQQVPALGRKTCGIIEIADGSRRRQTAIETKRPFFIWVGDLDEEQMQFLSDVGNQYKDTSAYEKGLRYERMLKSSNQEAVSSAIGMSRKAMMRYVQTASLPEALIKSFPSPNDLSARKGEALFKVWRQLNEEHQSEIIDYCKNWLITEKGQHTPDEIIELFLTKAGANKEKPEPVKPHELAMGATVALKNGNATINIPKVSDDSLKAIEDFISRILSEEAVKNC